MTKKRITKEHDFLDGLLGNESARSYEVSKTQLDEDVNGSFEEWVKDGLCEDEDGEWHDSSEASWLPKVTPKEFGTDPEPNDDELDS